MFSIRQALVSSESNELYQLFKLYSNGLPAFAGNITLECFRICKSFRAKYYINNLLVSGSVHETGAAIYRCCYKRAVIPLL